MALMWNLWHGCRRVSEGCRYCYMYRTDAQHGIDSTQVRKTGQFFLPKARKRNGDYKIPAGEIVWTCMTSDFFIEEADAWRPEAWALMQSRPDLRFMMITKRIERAAQCLPADWGEGYANVSVGCTVENNCEAARRLPIFREFPAAHRFIVCEPLLEAVDLSPWLGAWVERVVAGGESGNDAGEGARPCDFDWVLDLRRQCVAAQVAFTFHQTGSLLVKDGRLYRLPRSLMHAQARKAGVDFSPARPAGTDWPCA